MKVIKSLLILLFGLSHVASNAQMAGVCAEAVPYSNKAGNCIWLTNLSANQVKEHYMKLNVKPEKVTPVSDKTAEGYRLYYCQPGSKGWHKYWIKITTVNMRNSVNFYEDYNPDLLMVPFRELQKLVGKFGHTQSDFKKVYNKYQYLACKLYKQSKDSQGNPTSEMTALYLMFLDSIAQSNQQLLAAQDANGISPEATENDTWDYWLQYLNELSQRGYSTMIEYSTSPIQ